MIRFPKDGNDVFDCGFQDEKFVSTPELESHLADIAVCDGNGNEPLLAGLVLLLIRRLEAIGER